MFPHHPRPAEAVAPHKPTPKGPYLEVGDEHAVVSLRLVLPVGNPLAAHLSYRFGILAQSTNMSSRNLGKTSPMADAQRIGKQGRAKRAERTSLRSRDSAGVHHSLIQQQDGRICHDCLHQLSGNWLQAAFQLGLRKVHQVTPSVALQVQKSVAVAA